MAWAQGEYILPIFPIINMEELSKFDFDVKNYENPPIINNIAEALEVCHSRHEKLKKKNNQQ
jgi:hypothetical protein